MSVFIVEGKRDVERLEQAFPSIKTIMLWGTKFNASIKGRIDDYLQKGEKVYILTDPDPSGRETATRIKHYYKKDVTKIHVDPDEAKCRYNTRWKYGVEYCDVEYIRQLLQPYIDGTIITSQERIDYDYGVHDRLGGVTE